MDSSLQPSGRLLCLKRIRKINMDHKAGGSKERSSIAWMHASTEMGTVDQHFASSNGIGLQRELCSLHACCVSHP